MRRNNGYNDEIEQKLLDIIDIKIERTGKHTTKENEFRDF